ncbi:gliding motility-associated C-terminal domain-containing protein [Adhaeribacter swui]|uniref:Gliding motility-associated C-terminal domain-containing protein n=1 Tax=Adhaeribacter swui TaxID=2086471 RepID=A0A7G7GE68_9BACT|nr:gliding motility-associated C-terminal domain-containing protein [Adhaeribacter swui]QNF35452.1 gliding motility-associated C-terminal domain-containing protein [Adhaeribacter swui]
MCSWKKRLSYSLHITLLYFLLINRLAAQDCPVKPDATLRDVKTTGQPFVNCTNSSTAGYTLQVENISQTKVANTSYSIDWGDGSPVENFSEFTARKAHTYVQRGTYNLKFRVGINGCIEEKTYRVFHGSVPNVGLSYRDTDECSPASFTFEVTQTELNEPSTKYTLDFGDGTIITFDQDDPKVFQHTYNNPSKGKSLGYTIKVTASNACKTSERTGSGIYVSNGPTPDFRLEPGPVSCVNSPVTLTDISDYGYNATDPNSRQFERQWTIEPAEGWSYASGYNEKSEKPIIQFSKEGNYAISINLAPLEGTDPKCKGGTVTKSLKVISAPTASFNTTLNPLSGCASTVSMSNTSVGEAVSYLWTVTPSAGVTAVSGSFTSKDPVFRFANSGNYTFNLKVTNSCGTSNAPPKTESIKNIPTVTLPAAAAYCGPQTISFNAANAAHKPTYNFNNTTQISYEWTVSNGPAGGANFTTSDGRTVANPSIQFNQPGVYTVSVKVTSECGTSTQANQTITINAIPTAPEAENVAICINSTATLTTNTAGTIEWFSTATGGSRLNTLPSKSFTTPVLNAAGTYTYYVQTTVNNCVSPRQPVTVTVNPAIDPKVITGAAAICANSSPGLLTGPAATGGGSAISYLWESSTTSATATDFVAATGLNNSPNNQINFQPGVLSRTTYFRRKAISSPCATATSNVIAITVNPIPPMPIVPAVNPVCVGNTVTFTANAVTGVSYTWYDENNAVLPNSAANSNQFTTPALTREGTYTYYVSSKSTANCVSAKTAVTVQVLPAITNNRIVSEQPAICAGEIPGLIRSALQPSGGNGYGNFTYLWQSKTDRDTEWKTAASGPDPNYANTSENYQPTAITRTTTFRRVISSGSCATPSFSNEIVIEVIPSSLAPEVATVAPICSGESTQLRVTSTGGIYEWFTSPTATNSVFTGPVFTTPVLTATTTFYVHNRTTTCVSPRTPVVVQVNPVISNNTIAPVAAACADGKPNTLIGSDPLGGAGAGTYTYRWESRTEFTAFSPVNGDATFSNTKKDYAPGILNQTTWYRRIVKSGTCEDVSAEVKVDVLALITGNTIGVNGGSEFCAGENTTTITGLGTISGGTGQYTYVWESSTDEFRSNYVIVAQGTGNSYAEYSPQNLTQTTWFRRVITSGPCLANTSNVVKITINALPATPVVAPLAAICVGSSATLVVNPVTGTTFSVTDEKGNLIPNNTSAANRFTTPALIEPGAYTFFVKATNVTNCASAQTLVTVQVLPALANYNITQPEPICKGESPTEIGSAANPVGGNNTYTYVWESKAIDEADFKVINTAGNASTFKPGPLTKTTFFRRKITSGPCSEYSNVIEVKVNELLVNKLTGTNQEICQNVRPSTILGQAASGGDGANYQYVWETSSDNVLYTAATTATGESNSQANFQPALLTPGNWWFRRKVISGPCVSYSAPVLIKVNTALANNTIRLNGNLAICVNSKPDAIQGSLPTGGNGTPTYTWQVSLDGQQFTNAPQVNNLKDFTPGTLTQTTWYRRIVDAASCLPDTSNVIKVEVYQPVTNNIILTRDQEICLGSEAPVLEGSTPEKGNGQYTYRWESRRDNQAFMVATTSGSSDPTAKNYAPGTLAKGVWYFRRWVSSGPCQEVVSQVVKITVNDPLSGHFITANQTIRVGDKPAPLTGSRPKGGGSTITYRWEIKTEETGYFQPIAGNTNSLNYAPPVLSKTTWFRRIALSGGCESISNEIEITVAQAIANNIIAANQTVCYGSEPNLLEGSTPTGGDGTFTYIWEYSTTGLASDFVTAPNPSFDQNYQPGRLKETTWFRRKVSSAGNTHLSNTIKITVAAQISENSITGSQTICYNDTPTVLTGAPVTGGANQPDYLWESSTDGINFITAPGISNQASYSPGALTRTTWYRRNVSSGGCTNLASNLVQVTVVPLPVLAPVSPVTVCPGNSATLTVDANNYQIEWYETATSTTPLHVGRSFATPALNRERTYYAQPVNQGCAGERIAIKVLLEAPVANAGTDVTIEAGKSTELQGSGGVSYQWSPAEGLSDPNIANPIASPKETTRYTLTITNAQGCTATDEVVVALMPGVSVPNGFTPNGDGRNDVWELANIEQYPNCEVKIFNRWGTLLYTSSGYKQPWDGTYNQQALPVATYYYTIILKPGAKPLSGSVTIIK